jgi:hypothetical protein
MLYEENSNYDKNLTASALYIFFKCWDLYVEILQLVLNPQRTTIYVVYVNSSIEDDVVLHG